MRTVGPPSSMHIQLVAAASGHKHREHTRGGGDHWLAWPSGGTLLPLLHPSMPRLAPCPLALRPALLPLSARHLVLARSTVMPGGDAQESHVVMYGTQTRALVSCRDLLAWLASSRS